MAIDMNLKVLIVDDYKTMLRILANLLRQLKFTNIEEAMDGSEALRRLRAENFGLVISDWNMEPMTGIELLREVGPMAVSSANISGQTPPTTAIAELRPICIYITKHTTRTLVFPVATYFGIQQQLLKHNK